MRIVAIAEYGKEHNMKRKKVFVVIAVILALYVLIPVLSRQAPPFRLFHLNADKVTAIEVVHWGQSVQFDDPEEVTEIVNRLNHTYSKPLK